MSKKKTRLGIHFSNKYTAFIDAWNDKYVQNWLHKNWPFDSPIAPTTVIIIHKMLKKGFKL